MYQSKGNRSTEVFGCACGDWYGYSVYLQWNQNSGTKNQIEKKHTNFGMQQICGELKSQEECTPLSLQPQPQPQPQPPPSPAMLTSTETNPFTNFEPTVCFCMSVGG
jgi:hypothetical protein